MPDVHLTDEQLTQFRDGALRNPLGADHLSTCPACRNRLRDIRLLRVLLSRPEVQASGHPSAQDLANFLDGGPIGMALTALEAHVAACPQCFADLGAIRDQLQPQSAPEVTPPEWVVTRSMCGFRPSDTPLDLGTLVVRWLGTLGAYLHRVLPSEFEPLGQLVDETSSMVSPDVEVQFSLETELQCQMPLACYEGRAPDLPPLMPASGRASRQSVRVLLGPLAADIASSGEAPDRVGLVITIAQAADGTPVAGVELSLEAAGGPLATATTGADGVVRFALSPGQVRLVFHSPLRAELQISF